MIDVQEKKNKIISFLEQTGPSLPVRIAKAIEMEPVFTSAILSELLNSKQVITSHMKIGSSPLYLLPNQKEKLETQTEHLKQIEREAQEKLKEETILFDEKETPPTRVALRNIKDFATPFKFQEKIAWKYAFAPQEKIEEVLSPKPKEQANPEPEIIVEKTPEPEKKQENNIEDIFEKKQEPQKQETEQENKTFLEEVKQFLTQQNKKITLLEEVDSKKITAIIESDSQKIMLFAFNKKKINEIELFKCYKKAKKQDMQYYILTRDDPSKKMQETIDAYKQLTKLEKIV